MALIGIPNEVRASAKVILDYLKTVQICDCCDTDKIMADILDGMVHDEVTCGGGDGSDVSDAEFWETAKRAHEYLEALKRDPEHLERTESLKRERPEALRKQADDG